MISLCTWVKDWPPLRETLPHNLAEIAGRDVEWCITDLDSQDDTWDWLQSQAAQHEQLRVFRATIEPLHFARAYNQAFRQARGEILVCLDADNVLGPQYLDVVLRELQANSRAFVHVWTGDWLDGTCGRMAMSRECFDAIGGYDESFAPIGHQDMDLRDRAAAAGYPTVTINEPAAVGYAIFTPDSAKLQHLAGTNYQRCNTANVAISAANLAQGTWRANECCPK